MPNRMLRDWTDSLKFDGISADAERLFVRLIMKADDYGRFHADERLLKANCFPLVDNLRPPDIARWLDELSTRQLILRYEADGRKVLAITNYGQRLKSSRAKFPQIPGESFDWLPVSGIAPEVPGSSGNPPPEGKRSRREGEGEGKEIAAACGLKPLDLPETKTNPNRRATFEQVLKFGQGQMPPMSQECCEGYFDRMEADGWINAQGHPLADWRARFRTWATAWANNEAGRRAVK